MHGVPWNERECVGNPPLVLWLLRVSICLRPLLSEIPAVNVNNLCVCCFPFQIINVFWAALGQVSYNCRGCRERISNCLSMRSCVFLSAIQVFLKRKAPVLPGRYCSVSSLPFHVANIIIVVAISLLELELCTLCCTAGRLTGLQIKKSISFSCRFYGAATEVRPELKWWRKTWDGNRNDMISCQIS